MKYNRIEFDKQRYYEIPELGGRKLPSSTTILQVINKPALIPWAAKKTAEYIGEHLKDLSEGKVKIEDLNVSEILYGAKGEAEKQKQAAADIGTRVHDVISQFHEIELKNPKSRIPDDEAKIIIEKSLTQEELVNYGSPLLNCIDGFIKWRKETKFMVSKTEMTVWSRKYGYAGTFDAVGRINGIESIIDYKSSNGIWNEMFYQAASYKHAFQEMTGQKIKQAWIVRFGKEDGIFEAQRVKNERTVFKGFLAAKKLWEIEEFLKAEKKLRERKEVIK